jgi:transposase-like protein
MWCPKCNEEDAVEIEPNGRFLCPDCGKEFRVFVMPTDGTIEEGKNELLSWLAGNDRIN